MHTTTRLGPRSSSAPITGLLVAALLLAALLVAPSGAFAERQGFEAGVRLGYGIPFGEVSDPGGDLSDAIAGQIPLWLDLGYRVSDRVFLGLYGHYGFGFVGDAIDAACDVSVPGLGLDIDCSASDIRVGLQGHYHFMPQASADPWIGLGLGYEWMTFGLEGAGVELSATASGFEFLNLQAGLDVRATKHLFAGPFLSFSLGQYSDVSGDCSGDAAVGLVCTDDTEISGSIDDEALHFWLVIGVRGAYAP